MLLEGFVVLTQDQVNMLALAAEPASVSWDQPAPSITGHSVLVAPEWPEKLELDTWVAFTMEGVLYAFQPEVMKANVERILPESGGLSFLPAVHDQMSMGLFQQRSFSWWPGP